jgi:hypothetical protein
MNTNPSIKKRAEDPQALPFVSVHPDPSRAARPRALLLVLHQGFTAASAFLQSSKYANRHTMPVRAKAHKSRFEKIRLRRIRLDTSRVYVVLPELT